MNAARYDEPAPQVLQLVWMCGNHHLPDPGGMLDQDFELINKMRTLKYVYDLSEYIEHLIKKGRLNDLTEQQMEYWGWLMDIGAWDNASAR